MAGQDRQNMNAAGSPGGRPMGGPGGPGGKPMGGPGGPGGRPMGGPMGGPGRKGPMGPRPKIDNPGKLFKRLMQYVLKNYLVQCIIVLICIVVSVLANVQGTLFTKTLIDSYIAPLLLSDNPDFGPLAGAIGRVACFYAIGVAAAYAQSRIMINVSQGTMKRLRVDVFTHMESLPIKYFDTHSHGDIMSIYTNDIDTLRQMVSQSIPQIINSTITIVSVFGSMIALNIPLTVLSLIMVGVSMTAARKCTGISGRYFVVQQSALGKVNGFIEEMMNGQKVVKVFCHEEKSKEEFDTLNNELYEAARQANGFANVLGPINAQVGNISYVLCAIVGGMLALKQVGGFTLGGLASFLTFNKSFNMPINQVFQQFNSIIMALAGADRVFKLLDEGPEQDEGYVTLDRKSVV